MDDLEDVFGAHGPLARRVPGYAPRREQRAYPLISCQRMTRSSGLLVRMRRDGLEGDAGARWCCGATLSRRNGAECDRVRAKHCRRRGEGAARPVRI